MRLYKYMRALDDTICSRKNECKELEDIKLSVRLRKTLTYSRIYLSNPAVFNDPFDGYYWIEFGTEQDRKNAEKTLSENLEQALREKTITQERAEYLKESLFSRILLENYRVACFSKSGKNDLMWAHYADQHRGVCLVYEIDDEENTFISENNCFVFVDSLKDDNYGYFGRKIARILLDNVIYDNIKIPLKILDGKVVEEYNTAISMYTKSEIWKDEEEVRLTAMLPYEYAFGDDTYFCMVNKECLKEIRFGVRLEEQYQKEIQRIVQSSGYNDVSFKKATINTEKFALDFEDVL